MIATLTPERVSELFEKCLFQDGEDTSTAVVVEGIVANVGFHPGRLAAAADEIRALLNELPEKFRENEGGGWSFLNACMDRHDHQWTGVHSTMEQLFLLGLASGQVECLLPRELWSVLPGGMPYYMIKAQ